MRIPSFTPFIKKEALQPHTLANTELVIDGFNYFFQAYKDSELPYTFGAESDRFAEHIRRMLKDFRRANLKCYFIFKRGYNKFPTELEKSRKNISRSKAAEFVPGAGSNRVVPPVFMKEIYEEILNETGMEYCVSVGDSKEECVALAREVGCPILSYDNEYCFLGVPYIPHASGQYFDWKVSDEGIQCEIFDLEYFKNKYKLNNGKLAIFIMLVDQNQLGENFLADFLNFLQKPQGRGYGRFHIMLFWLSETTEDQALAKIFAFLDEDGQKKFATKHELVIRNFVDIHPKKTITTRFFVDNDAVQFTGNDPEWLEKGIAFKHVPMIYINLLKFGRLNGSWVIEDLEEDALLLSIPIVKYSFDLLTNFQNDGFTFAYHGLEILIKDSVRKPDYEGRLFENGWDDLDKLYLFGHFLNESLEGIDFDSLEQLSDDVKLLIIALIYFSQKKGGDMSKEVRSVILSYVMLCSVLENNNNVTDEDRSTAAAALKGYFKLSLKEERKIFNRKYLQPLVQFQHCLQKLNCLNALCGKPFQPTLYHKTYNATFVYKILYAMRQNGGGHKEFFQNLLINAPTVQSYFNNIADVYERMMEIYK